MNEEEKIILDSEDLKINAKKRLTKELNLSEEEAKYITNRVRDIVKRIVDDKELSWTDEVVRAFCNHYISILIKSLKRIYKKEERGGI